MMNPGYESVKGTPMSSEIAELRAVIGQMKDREPAGPPSTLTVPAMMGQLGKESGQLIEEIQELRARLAPLLSDRQVQSSPVAMPIVGCTMSAELGEIYLALLGARERIEIILYQLDI